MKNFLTEEQIALLELCLEPQSYDSVKKFLKMDTIESVKKEINKLKYKGLVHEVKGPTYNFWETNDKGKEMLDE